MENGRGPSPEGITSAIICKRAALGRPKTSPNSETIYPGSGGVVAFVSDDDASVVVSVLKKGEVGPENSEGDRPSDLATGLPCSMYR
jgi:hypothetical protein